VAVILFACGLLFGDLLGSSNYPALNASYAHVSSYFLRNGSEVKALAFFHLLSAVAFVCFAAYLRDWLRRAPEAVARWAPLALAGGATAAAFLLSSALIYRTLAEPMVVHDRALTHALVVLSYLTGGAAIAVPLALPVAASALAALRHGMLPRWTGWLGVLAAAVGLICAATVLGPMNNSSALYGILLVGAILLFAWTFATSVLLAARA
jgi:hypothetical protein